MGVDGPASRRHSFQSLSGAAAQARPGFMKKLFRRFSSHEQKQNPVTSRKSSHAIPSDSEGNLTTLDLITDSVIPAIPNPEHTFNRSPFPTVRSKTLKSKSSHDHAGRSSIVDVDSASLWDFHREHEGEARNSTDRLESHSTYSSSLHTNSSCESRGSRRSYETSSDAGSLGSSHLLSDLPVQAFEGPRYVRVLKKNRHSPGALDKLFLAQHLNDPGAESSARKNSSTMDTSSVISIEGKPFDTAADIEEEEELERRRLQCEILLMEFSRDGKYLATGGRDCTIKIWKVISSPLAMMEIRKGRSPSGENRRSRRRPHLFERAPVFYSNPLVVLRGHSEAVLSLNWSKNNFLVLGSMDRTAKLWHINSSRCLKSYQHSEFVTLVKFHSTDDRFFVSGSLDNKVRLWSILEHSVAYESDLGDDFLVTALAMTPDGATCAAGGFNGSVAVLDTKGLFVQRRFEIKQIHSAHSFHHNKEGNKVSGIKLFLNEEATGKTQSIEKWKALLTTNDSKVRLVNTWDKQLVTRFKGATNNSSSIVADISDDRRFVISGSEDHRVYVWENNNDAINSRLKMSVKELMHGVKPDVGRYKDYFKYIHKKLLRDSKYESDDFEFVANENSSYSSFHAHHSTVNAAIFAPETTKLLLKQSDDEIYDLIKRDAILFSDDKDNKNSTTGGAKINADAHANFAQGNIIVTTDQYGSIKVFRQDMAYDARKRLWSARRRGRSLPKPTPLCSICPVNAEPTTEINRMSAALMDLPSTGLKLIARGLSPVPPTKGRPPNKSFSQSNSVFGATNMASSIKGLDSSSLATPATDSTASTQRIVQSSSMMRLDSANALSTPPPLFGGTPKPAKFDIQPNKDKRDSLKPRQSGTDYFSLAEELGLARQ